MNKMLGTVGATLDSYVNIKVLKVTRVMIDDAIVLIKVIRVILVIIYDVVTCRQDTIDSSCIKIIKS